MKYYGLDYSVDDKKKVLSVGELDDKGKLVCKFVTGRLGGNQSKERISNAEIKEYVLGAGNNFVLAVDAPFGWPSKMSEAICGHFAGNYIEADNRLEFFRRHTDAVIQSKLQKASLLVGADKIGITAYECLHLINEFDGSAKIDVIGDNIDLEGGTIIETYPGALMMNFMNYNSLNGYKSNPSKRISIYNKIVKSYIALDESIKDKVLSSEDHLDSILCLIAAYLYTDKQLLAPSMDKQITAKKEGWIWAVIKEMPLTQQPRKPGLNSI